jgi:hypothetical protein
MKGWRFSCGWPPAVLVPIDVPASDTVDGGGP